MKLTIELVPSTAWFSNLRSILSQKDWDTLRKESYLNANYKCEICEGKGKKHPVECHEIWSYDDTTHIQTLDGLISLCPKCHMVKHIGYAFLKGNGEKATKHFKKINQLDAYEAHIYIEEAFQKHNERSQYQWTINLDYLLDKKIELNV